MALDYNRLGLENKFLENKSGRIFCVRQVYSLLHKILPTSLGTCKPTLYFLYITSEVKQYHEALFLSYRPRTECSISQFCNTSCTHSPDSLKIQDDRGTRVLLFKKKIQNHLHIRRAGSHFCQAPKSTV